jgi:IS5 family transposase
MHRLTGQPSFVDAFIAAEGLGRNPDLEAIEAAIDWDHVTALVASIHAAPEGRPGYPPGVMVKALLLQQWHGLSDPRLEFALRDSLSFRRFVGLSAQDASPDHSSISRFRKALGERGLDAALFLEIARQLDAQGLMVKSGTILDATLVRSAAKKPAMGKGAGARSDVDPDADWGRGGSGRSVFGYKAHIGVDLGSGLIRRALLTPAKVYESETADALVCGDERAVYADRAYEKQERRARLKQCGIKDRIMHRANKHQPRLTFWRARRNALIIPIRQTVERTFGTWKRSYGWARARYMGLTPNPTQLYLICIAFNLRKAIALRS